MRKCIEEQIAAQADRFPEKHAIITLGESITYGELDRLIGGYASYLKAKGVGRGDIVLARAAQTIEFAVLYFGTHLAGGVISPLEENTPVTELPMIARQIGARLVVDSSADDTAGLRILPRAVVEDAKAFAGSSQSCFPFEDELADVLFTTGTTGISKGVALTHGALSATAENLTYGCGYREDTVMVAASPLNHAHAIRHLYTTLVNGGTFYLLNGMTNLKKFYQALDYPCEKLSCWLPPSAIRMLFMLSGNKLGEYANKLEFLEVSTQPLSEADKEKLRGLLPKTRLLNCYGSSESGVACMYDFQKYPDRAGCVGKATPNTTIAFVDDDRNTVTASIEHPGLIACSGDTAMRGYINEPELTKLALSGNTVFTSDLGYMDEDGFVYVIGRQGDVINVGGLKVAPTEVEEAALGFDGVEDCVCIAKDHPISGKTPKLLVVMKQNRAFDAKELREYLLERLESYKVPTSFERVDTVKRTYNGKIDRKAYR
ncbi:MAG: acyl--CoA ligase [Ruminococcaceae bacterium]|nr:acyl--CoA ligase [Oscillospiraceae bacterium]